MKRKILSLILCCALLLSLSACGKAEAPQPAADAGTETAPDSGLPAAAEGISYADAYTQYTAIYGALLSPVQQRLDAHDARLQAAYPDSYYMNSDYLLLVYVPFMTAYPSLGRELRADDLDAAQTSLRETFPDAVLTSTAPGRYEAVYTYVDKTSGTEVQRDGRCQWDCDGLTGAIRVRAYIDGELTEFTEFVPLGGSRCGRWQAIRNTFVVFLVSGLWHGANWTFLAWGAFHACCFLPLLLRGTNRRYLGPVAEGRWLPSVREVWQMGCTFALAALGWLFFRAATLSEAWAWLQKLFLGFDFSLEPLRRIGYWRVFPAVGLLLICEWVNRTEAFGCARYPRWRLLRWLCYLALVAFIFLWLSPAQVFIYFQF